jgi:RNA polymerase sigma-70 factor (ECF subfamily)
MICVRNPGRNGSRSDKRFSERTALLASEASVFELEALPHLNALHNAAVHLTREKTEAEDLVQETVLRAFRFFHLYKQGTNCKAWLFTILRNTFINQCRKKCRHPRELNIDLLDNTAGFSDTAWPVAELRTPAVELLQTAYDDEVSAALDSIPGDFREVLLLSDVEGFSYQEIADILGVPLGTVRSRLSRARNEMREALSEYAVRNGVIGRSSVAASRSVSVGGNP